MTNEDCLKALKEFATKVRRFGETSDSSMFSVPSVSGEPPMRCGEINVQFCVEGSFGVADKLYEAIRHLRKS